MKSQKVTPEEIKDIVLSAGDMIEKKLDPERVQSFFEQGAQIVPALIKATIAFIQWLSDENRIEEEAETRDVLKESLVSEMKKRIDS
jgi:hypothetical protein